MDLFSKCQEKRSLQRKGPTIMEQREYRVTRFPTHVGRCEFGNGCYHCDLDVYTVEKGGRTISLWEYCYEGEGEWTRVRRRVFEVVRPSKLFLVDCAESRVRRSYVNSNLARRALSRKLARSEV